MKSKKMIALVISTCICISIFDGCSSSSKSNTTASNKSTTAQEAPKGTPPGGAPGSSSFYSYAEMINDFPDEVTPDQTQIIMDETQRLKTLVNDVLDISKLESGMQGLSLSIYNLTRSVASTTNRINELVKKNGYSISFIYDKEVFIYAKICHIFGIDITKLIKNISVQLWVLAWDYLL